MNPISLVGRLLAVFTLAFLPGHATANDSVLLDRLVAQLSAPSVVRAEFVQEKRLAVLTRPLLSRGRIAVARGEGVLWQMEAPLRMSVAFSERHVVEIDAEGRRRVRSLLENRAQAEVGRIFKGLLAADMDSLRRHFQIAAEGDLQRWHINLTPRSREVGQFIKGIELSGSKYIDTIRVDEAGGDSTLIRLRNVETPAALTPNERALFTTS